MSRSMIRYFAVAGVVVLTAATGYVASVLTASPSAPWWWAAAVLVVLTIALKLLDMHLARTETGSGKQIPVKQDTPVSSTAVNPTSRTTINAPGSNVIAGNTVDGDFTIKGVTFNANGNDDKDGAQ